ncbi:MarR family transcriptional regulator [Aquabacterium sp. A7-Y]|uniref:MarR family winged helix-turn-helix transcriptional regulator n=1 Tax=Aquabacterium sp. A7-Y TaxID=1349605 RepID=UPI00223C955E|nr:MarR family transcriptional regulator [Aquabacterium sp. A7-Y]MCW7537633.1 MarR family transcriptional regulator [Aquabacterium sp. A7-Y]
MSRVPKPAEFYRADGYTADESVGHLMRRVLGLIANAVDRRLAPQGLTHVQWAPLYKIRAFQATTVAELARQTQTDTGAMTRLLDRLESKGLCRRVRSTQDRRVVQIELTPEGERLADEVPGVLSEVLNAHLAGFSEPEWQTLKDYLRRMIANGEALRGEERSDS